MDGFPDLIVTLVKLSEPQKGHTQTFLLENKSCDKSCGLSTRTFKVLWNGLELRADQQTLMGSFFDFSQNGVLDVILVEKIGTITKLMAIQRTTDSDTNFLKVMVLAGVTKKGSKKKFGESRELFLSFLLVSV
jgi:integrin alpha FG-GAP repeat containing protein 1